MSEDKPNCPEEISIPAYAGHGTGRLLLRAGLPWHHPWSEYSYVKNELKLDPADYGIKGGPPYFCDCCGQQVGES